MSCDIQFPCFLNEALTMFFLYVSKQDEFLSVAKHFGLGFIFDL